MEKKPEKPIIQSDEVKKWAENSQPAVRRDPAAGWFCFLSSMHVRQFSGLTVDCCYLVKGGIIECLDNVD